MNETRPTHPLRPLFAEIENLEGMEVSDLLEQQEGLAEAVEMLQAISAKINQRREALVMFASWRRDGITRQFK